MENIIHEKRGKEKEKKMKLQYNEVTPLKTHSFVNQEKTGEKYLLQQLADTIKVNILTFIKIIMKKPSQQESLLRAKIPTMAKIP